MQVFKRWKETEATAFKRIDGENWNAPHLSLNGIDGSASSSPPVIVANGRQVACHVLIIRYNNLFLCRSPGYVEFNVKLIAKEWFENNDTNYGVVLRATEEVTTFEKSPRFSTDEGPTNQRPYLQVVCA